METVVFENLDPESPAGRQWESLVRNNPASGIMQSLYWARFKKAQGLDSLHLGLCEQGRLVGGAIFYVAPNNRGAGILVAPEGPVLDWSCEDNARRGLRAILTGAQVHAGRCDAMAVRVEPRIPAPGNSVLGELGRAPIDLIPRETLYIDLQCGPEEILARMKPKGRYNIRLASRKGVVIRCEEDPFVAAERLYCVLVQVSQRDGFFLEPLSFFRRLVDTLCACGLARVFFAEHEGDTLGALLLTTYGARGTYLYGGITNIKRQLMAGYLLQWIAMNAARNAGCTTYDFYGFDQFQAPENNYSRFSRFKSKFGGEPVRFAGAHDHFFLDNLADVIIRAISEMSPGSHAAGQPDTFQYLLTK